MKRFIYATFILATCTIVSCKKKDNTPSKFYGTSLEFTVDSCGIMQDSAYLITEFSATDSTFELFSNSSQFYSAIGDIIIPRNIGVGVYPFDSLHAPMFVYVDESAATLGHYVSISGNLTITECDTINHNMKGSFEAFCRQEDTGNLRQISNGHFQFHY